MFSSRLAPALAIVGLALLPSGNALSQQVCGIDITGVEAFGLAEFSWGRGKDALDAKDAAALNTALRDELLAESADWPQSLADQALLRVRELQTMTLPPADWLRSETNRTEELDSSQSFVFGGDRRIWFPPEEGQDECGDDPRMWRALAEFAVFADLVGAAHGKMLETAISAVQARVAVLEEQYDSYLFEGFPMFPWEAAVNGWFLTDKSIANGPPRWQLSVLHPSAGMVGHVDSDTDGDIGASLLVDAIGFVRYSKDYKQWYGASILTSFPSDREPGIGIGLTYNQFKLGVTWHDDPSGAYDGAAIVLGIELFQLVGERRRQYDGYRRKVRELLEGTDETP